MKLTEEEKQTLRKGDVLRLVEEDVECVVLRADLYNKVKTVLFDGDSDVSHAYPLLDEVMREGWDDPRMAEYDEYESHRQ